MKIPFSDDLIINEETLPVITRLAESIPSGFFIYRAYGAQELIYFNSRLPGIFGCDNDEQFRALTGNSFRGIVHPDDYARCEAEIAAQIETDCRDIDHIRYRFIRKDGSVGMMDDYGHFSRSEVFGEIYYVFVQDISEEYTDRQKTVQTELIRQFLDYEGVFLIDCVNDTRRTVHDRLSGAAYYDDAVNYSALFAAYVDNCVCGPDKELMEGFVEPANILKLLGGRSELSLNYRDRTTGTQRFYEMRIVRISDTEVLQCFRENDAGMVNDYLFEKLKDNYFAIFGVDLETGLMRSYKDDPLHVAGAEGEVSTFSGTMLKLASLFEGEERAFFERNSDVRHIRESFASQDRAEFRCRSAVGDGTNWVNVTGIVFKRNADGTPSLFCLAFNRLDERSSRVQEMQQQLKTALEEARAANVRIAEQQLLAGKAEQARKEQIARTAGAESAYIVDPRTERFQILNQNEYLSENYTADEDFNESFSRYIAADVFEPDREYVSQAVSIPAMVAHLENEDEYIVRYRDISKGVPRWYEMRAVRLSENEILYSFADKDDEIITQLMADKFRESYFGLYYVNLDSGIAQIIKTGHPELTGEPGEYVSYSALMKNIAAGSSGEAAEFISRNGDIGHIRKWFAGVDVAYRVYKSYIFEGSRWVNYTGRVLQRHEDGTPSVFALAFSLLDEEAAAKEEADLRLKDALEETEAANRAKTALVNAFKSMYQVMYAIDMKECRTEFLYGDEEAEKFLPIFNAGTPEKIIDNFRKYYIDALVLPEDRERVAETMNIPNIYRTLKTNSSISVNYRVRRNLVDPVYTEMSIIKASEAEDGGPASAILAFRLTGDELREALETRKRLEADARIIGAMSEDFGSVDYVELAEDKAEDVSVGVRSSGTLKRIIPEWDSISSFSEKMELFCEKLVYAPDREDFRRAISRETVLEKLAGADTYYFNIMLQIDGEVCYYQAKTSAVREGGKLVGVVAGIRSVDEYMKKELEVQQQLKEALDEAESASRAKSDFLFNMSHDIRTPMNAILGFTGMAQRYLDKPEKLSDYLGKIEASGQQLLELINQVLEMSRIESGKLELTETPVNIMEQYSAAVTVLAEQAAHRGLEFHHSLSDAVHLNVLADTAKMSSITMNITGNAIKYTPRGGRIDYILREVPARRPGFATYVFTVADTGIGMSEEFISKLFDPFSREQNSTVSRIQGTGLGMSIVKELVDLIGGSIEVSSEPGRGTRFDITADFRLNAEAEKKDAEEQCAAASIFAGRRALLVEDNELNREIALEILEEEGILTEEAEDGDVAVELLREKGPDYYDFILMDIQMPRMNGYDATMAIRKLYPESHIPIIAVSANAFEEDRRASKRAGMDAHIAKPVNIGVLFDTLAEYL